MSRNFPEMIHRDYRALGFFLLLAVVALSSCSTGNRSNNALIKADTMTYYSFLIDDHKVGYFEMDFQQNILYQNAHMTIDGASFDNPFWLKIGDDQRFLVNGDHAQGGVKVQFAPGGQQIA